MKKDLLGLAGDLFSYGLFFFVEIVSTVGVGCFNGGEDGLRGYFEWHVVEGVGLCACGFGYFHELVVGYVSGTASKVIKSIRPARRLFTIRLPGH